ncbi:MAG: helix-turn-helix domain-containing protein [Candidatus Woesearchaeota archaeon]
MEDALRTYGLSEKEVKIYLASLKLGAVTANRLAVESGLRRSTTYEVLDALKQKGIMAGFIQEGKQHFQAAEPQRLISLAQEKSVLIQSILPKLEGIRQFTSEKPHVQLYIGKDGVQTIFEDILSQRADHLAITNNDIFNRLGYFFPHFIQRRIKLGLNARVIQEASREMIKYKSSAHKKNREIRFSDKRFDSSIFIYQDKVAFIKLTQNDILGILITDATLANTQRQLYEILWQTSKQ